MWSRSDKNRPELIEILITEVFFWSDCHFNYRDEYNFFTYYRGQVLNFGQNIHPCNWNHDQTRKTLQWLKYQSAQGLDWKRNFCLIAITFRPEKYLKSKHHCQGSTHLHRRGGSNVADQFQAQWLHIHFGAKKCRKKVIAVSEKYIYYFTPQVTSNWLLIE